MITAIADTHTALWYLYQDSRLSLPAQRFIEKSAQVKGQKIGVSSISLVEIVYLVEKARVPLDAYASLVKRFKNPADVFQEIPVTEQVIQFMSQVPREQIPDLPDRIIAATAIAENVAVITRDGKIHTSDVRCIW